MLLKLIQLIHYFAFIIFQRTKLFEELGPLLWNTVGTIAVFLQVCYMRLSLHIIF